MQKSNGFVNRAQTLFRKQLGLSGQEEKLAIKVRADFLDIGRIEGWVLPGKIHFSDDRAGGDMLLVGRNFLGCENNGCVEQSEANGSNPEHYGVYRAGLVPFSPTRLEVRAPEDGDYGSYI